MRGPARDALLASLTSPAAYGRAFGIERAGDNLGAVVGPLLAAAMITWIGIRPTLYLAAVPGLFAAVAILIAAREARRHADTRTGVTRRIDLAALRKAGMPRALVPVALFEFGNLATTLLILRATQLPAVAGRSATAAASVAILLYAAHNVVAAVCSVAAGRWLDRVGPAGVFATGGLSYVAGYAVFAAGPHHPALIAAGFVAAGVGIGLAEPTQSVVVAHLLPDRLRGSGYGVLGGVQALGDLVATLVAGLLYSLVCASAAFGYAAAWMLASATAAGALRPRPGEPEQP